MDKSFTDGVRLREALLQIGEKYPELGEQERLISQAKTLLEQPDGAGIADARTLLDQARALNQALVRRGPV